MKQDDILKLAAKHYPTFYSMGLGVDIMGFERGYELGCKLTKENLYTEKQVMELIGKIRTELVKNDYNHYSIDYDKIIQSLKEDKKN